MRIDQFSILLGHPETLPVNPVVNLQVERRNYTLCEVENLGITILKMVKGLRANTTHPFPCTYEFCLKDKWCGVWGGVVGK